MSVRAAYIGPFAALSTSDVYGTVRSPAAATGVETCLGVVPRGAWINPFSGCALTVSWYSRGEDGLFLVGLAPQILLTGADRRSELAVVPQFAMGSTTGNSHQLTYYVAGLGLRTTHALTGPVRLEAEGGFRWITARPRPSGTDPTAVPAYVTAGLLFRI